MQTRDSEFCVLVNLWMAAKVTKFSRYFKLTSFHVCGSNKDIICLQQMNGDVTKHQVGLSPAWRIVSTCYGGTQRARRPLVTLNT